MNGLDGWFVDWWWFLQNKDGTDDKKLDGFAWFIGFDGKTGLLWNKIGTEDFWNWTPFALLGVEKGLFWGAFCCNNLFDDYWIVEDWLFEYEALNKSENKLFFLSSMRSYAAILSLSLLKPTKNGLNLGIYLN